MEDKNIYSKIRSIRQTKGISVNTLAQKIGEDHQKVGRIERGKRRLTIDYLIKVSKALDTPLEEFISQENADTLPSDLLSEIVTIVDEKKLQTKNKGKLVSKLFELASKFPHDQQRLFLDSFFEGLEVFEP